MNPIDFRSDTVTQPTAEMRAAMMSAPLGDDVFGDDPTVNLLQEEAAEALGFERALFVPSGTQSNLIALMSHCERGDEAILGQQAHTFRWEAGGLAVLGSIQPQPLENAEDGTIPIESIEGAIKPDDPHFAKTRLIALENTIGGKVLPPAYMPKVIALAAARGLSTHLDGARLFNAAVALAAREVAVEGEAGEPTFAAVMSQARHLCSGLDSVSICLSKGLGAPAGSLLLGSSATIRRAHRIRKLLGGAMRQSGVLAAAGRYALANHLTRLSRDHRNATRLAEGLRSLAVQHPVLKGALTIQAPQTNMVFVDIDRSIADGFNAHLAKVGIRITSSSHGGGTRQRWVTHLGVNDDDVARALQSAADWRA